ncbi:HAD-IIB family hydrolase [Paroceanicella profunda]|uniref:HAD-IIB family hydrolase n=1 Tax=Paroceanicella profunda TaxID=2579971 RepID=A0A5B8FZH8_9RHOB|nr:HAD-IIB family hydrolase [Paroceanicella profunda]QDL92790.1 HAD-IIB family hydrolase [Paroceanicella profunda]
MTDILNPATAISGWKSVLATDLDGTFLGGSEADRRELYDYIEANRERFGLVFVTGRDPKFIGELCDGGVPWPLYVVGDVGTTIARVADGRIEMIDELEREIAETWADRGAFFRELLAEAPGLRAQDTPFRHRQSFHYDPETFDDTWVPKIEEHGVDVLISDNRYLDVLPKGVSKGPSLLRLIDHLGLDADRVLVAGDTLNDLSMFQTGLKGAVVGGAEPALTAHTRDLPNALACTRVGAGGITEALGHFGLTNLEK